MTTPKPDAHATAAAYVDRSWQTAPIDELLAAFKAAFEAGDHAAAEQRLHQLHARTMSAKAEREKGGDS